MNRVKVFESTLESEILQVVALLEERGIICDVQSEGIGQYLQIYSGINCMGTGIFVHENDVNDAKNLIDTYWGQGNFEEEVEENLEESLTMETYRASRKHSMTLKRKFIAFMVIFLLGSGLFFQLISILVLEW